MSIASEVQRIKNVVAAAYTAAERKGAEMPEQQNVSNLSGTIESITGGGGGGQSTLILNKLNGAAINSSYIPDYSSVQNNCFAALNLAEEGCIPFFDLIKSEYNHNAGGGYVRSKGAGHNWPGYYIDQDAPNKPILSSQSKYFSIIGIGVDYTGQVYAQVTGTTLALGGETTNGSENGSVAVEFALYVCNSDGSKWDYDTFKFWVSSGGCFLKGIKIKLASGEEKNCEDITYDDELLVWDFDNGRLSSAKPIWIKKAEKIKYAYKNSFRSGNSFITTGKNSSGSGHRMFDLDRNTFKYDTESVGDNIFTLSGPDMHVKCELIEGDFESYNIITDYHMNLFANGILTSCSLNNIYPFKDMKFDKPPITRNHDILGIDEKWVKGLRLNEQNRSEEDIRKYVNNLVDLMV